MSTTVDPRIAILSNLNDPPYNETAEKRCVPWDEAVKLLDAYRAAVLREAADRFDEIANELAATQERGRDVFLLERPVIRDAEVWRAAAKELRRMAEEKPQREEDA